MPSISSSSKPKHSKSQRTKHPLLDHAPIQSSPTGQNGPRGRLTSSHARLSSRQNPHRRRVRRTTQPSQPAVSSLGGFRTPAPVHVERFVTGRHPKTFTEPASREVKRSEDVRAKSRSQAATPAIGCPYRVQGQSLMRRREFIAGLGVAASLAAWSVAALGQQGSRARRVGVLMQLNKNNPCRGKGIGSLWVADADRGTP